MKKQKWAMCNYCGRIYKLGKKQALYNSCKYCAPVCWLEAVLSKGLDPDMYKEEGVKDMHDIKLVIDGNEIQLTEEQLVKGRMNTSGLLPRSENPFVRVEANRTYYTLSGDTYIATKREDNTIEDDKRYDTCNYFNDMFFASNISLQQLLYRKLLKYAYDNNCLALKPPAGEFVFNFPPSYVILYDYPDSKFAVDGPVYSYKGMGVHFSTRVAAEAAIKEVVELFIEKYPAFIW